MAINYAALQTELQNDPQALGYAARVTAKADGTLADMLNQVRAAIAIDRGVISSYEIINATVVTEWTALTAAEKQRYQTITGAGQVDSSNANVRASFNQMFAAGTTTRANLIALLTRQGSRAEQLFGAGVRVDHTDVARAFGRGF